jgi:hypothetical protein
MGLQSQLFQGDAKLEACLTQDSAHIVQGAVGEHVSKVQTALSTLETLGIDSNELSTRRYGPSTAAAVLAFKRKRSIINRSYQTQADDIVGKMTIAALDREMLNYENQPSLVNCCVMNTSGGEIVRGGSSPSAPSQTQTSAIFAQSAPVGQLLWPLGQTPSLAALAATPLAQFWVSLGALSELSVLRALRFTADLKSNPALPFPSVFDIVNTHFHLDREPARLAINLLRLYNVFGLIQRTLNDASTFFRDGALNANSPFADAPMGGFQLPGTQYNRITFRPGFLTCGPNTRAAMIVHECAHFVGGLSVIDHFAREFPIPNGLPQGPGHTRNYQQLRTQEALRNASSYAAYAIHAATLQDSRFGGRNIKL